MIGNIDEVAKAAINAMRSVQKTPDVVSPADPAKPVESNSMPMPEMKPEGKRTKLEEMEACYAMLFSQINPVMEENKRLKESLYSGEISVVEKGTIEHLVKREIPRLLLALAEIDDIEDEVGISQELIMTIELALIQASDQLRAIRPYLRTPEPVSIEDCAWAIAQCRTQDNNPIDYQTWRALWASYLQNKNIEYFDNIAATSARYAKAALDVAGVPYAD